MLFNQKLHFEIKTYSEVLLNNLKHNNEHFNWEMNISWYNV